MKFIVTTTTTDLITNKQKVETASFGDHWDALDLMEMKRKYILKSKEVISDELLVHGEGYIIEYAPKMQVVIEITVVD